MIYIYTCVYIYVCIHVHMNNYRYTYIHSVFIILIYHSTCYIKISIWNFKKKMKKEKENVFFAGI